MCSLYKGEIKRNVIFYYSFAPPMRKNYFLLEKQNIFSQAHETSVSWLSPPLPSIRLLSKWVWKMYLENRSHSPHIWQWPSGLWGDLLSLIWFSLLDTLVISAAEKTNSRKWWAKGSEGSIDWREPGSHRCSLCVPHARLDTSVLH